jgi:hypothetical protein
MAVGLALGVRVGHAGGHVVYGQGGAPAGATQTGGEGGGGGRDGDGDRDGD